MLTSCDQKIRHLYKNYFVEEGIDGKVTSSHWKEMHKGTAIEFHEGRITSLHGKGFSLVNKLGILGKTMSWITILIYLFILNFRNKLIPLIKTGIAITDKMGLPFTYDCFRQICTYVLLKEHLKTRKSILIIGDGFGFLSAFIKELEPDKQITLVDLGKTLLFQVYYINKVHPNFGHQLITYQEDSAKNKSQSSESDFVYCPSDHLDKLNTKIFDIAVNVASMQEMNGDTVTMYFKFLRSHLNKSNLFYCCNRENKIMPDGEVSEFYKYPWKSEDVHLVDELCPWHRFFISFGKTKKGLKMFGIRLPFFNYFDGDHYHRLSELKTVHIV